MTGVGTAGEVARPEVIIEVSYPKTQQGADATWQELDFAHKPGNVSLVSGTAGGAWVAPHQPRLDWQVGGCAAGAGVTDAQCLMLMLMLMLVLMLALNACR